MALPNALRKTLKNVSIPLLAMTCLSGAAVLTTVVGMIANPGQSTRLAEIGNKFSSTGIVASTSYLAIALVLKDDRRRRRQPQRAEIRGNQEAWVEAGHQSSDALTRTRELRDAISRPQSWIKPDACMGCQHYHGYTYSGDQGNNTLVCAMHPTGPIGETCPDHEGYPKLYKLVRIQGLGESNLYFVRVWEDCLEPGAWQMFMDAIFVVPRDRDRLLKRFNLRSSSGLPGCEFTSKSDIQSAYQELLDSCPQ